MSQATTNTNPAPKFALNKSNIGFVLGIVVLLLFWFVDITPGLAIEGRRVLALVLFSVIWWATKPVAPPFTALIMLLGFMAFDLASMRAVTAMTSGSVFFIYFAVYVIADVVEKSGLATRIAYWYAGRFIKSFTGIIVSAFVLTFLLGFLIPSPWPRAFLLLAVFKQICNASEVDETSFAIVGLAIFAASCPISMSIYTGDAPLSAVVAGMTGQTVSYMDWTLKMIIPGLLATVITYFLIRVLFKPTQSYKIDGSVMQDKLNDLGTMKRDEKVTLIWVVIATLLWMTEGIHGLNTGVVGMIAVAGMALPYIGGVCKPGSFAAVDFASILFIMGAMAIGPAGAESGMSAWLAQVVFPANMPDNIYAIALIIGAITVFMHMILGSSVSTAGVVVAMVLAYFQSIGSTIDPLMLTLFVYTAVYMHYLFPFQHLNIMFGVGKAGFTEQHVLKLGLALTPFVFVVLLFEAWLWQFMGWL